MFIITCRNEKSWTVSSQKLYSNFFFLNCNNNAHMYRLLRSAGATGRRACITCKNTWIIKQNCCSYLEGGGMPHSPVSGTDPTHLFDKSRVLLTPHAGLSVRCWANVGARAEGHRQFEAWCWEVKQRWGGCWRAGWLDPQAVHFPEPKRKHASVYADFLSSVKNGTVRFPQLDPFTSCRTDQ